MLLVLAATEFEMMSFKSSMLGSDDKVMMAVCGVGPVESAVGVMRLLGEHAAEIKYVVNFGIGGAYLGAPNDHGLGLLDICLAESEVLGDYGVCYGNEVEPFADQELAGKMEFTLSNDLLDCARRELSDKKLDFFSGPFVTVNGASGTAERGRFIKRRFKGICENMEGAAIARCCEMFALPMIEARVVSNMVEDRPGEPWKLKEACSRSGYIASLIVHRLKDLL